MNEPYRLRYTNQIVGVFLLVFFLILIVVSIVLLQTKVGKVRYWARASEEEISGLKQGAAVMILGEAAGEVESIRYEEGSDKIRVNLSIDQKMSEEIFKNSIVSVERKYGVAVSSLVIRRPKTEGVKLERLPPDSQIVNFQGEADKMEELAQEVKSVSRSFRIIQEDLTPTLESIDSAAIRFQGSLDNSVNPAFDKTGRASDSFLKTNETLRPDVLETSQTIRAATENLEDRIEELTLTIDRLVDQDMRDTLADVRESSQRLSEAAESVNQTSDELNLDFGLTLAKLRAAIEQFHELSKESRDVVRIVRSEAEDLPGTTANVNDTVSDTQELVGEIRSHWLLRRYSNQQSSTPPISPSSVRGGPVR